MANAVDLSKLPGWMVVGPFISVFWMIGSFLGAVFTRQELVFKIECFCFVIGAVVFITIRVARHFRVKRQLEK